MDLVSEYHRGEGSHYDWHDVLARRLTDPTTRLQTLAVSCDGRVALGTTKCVSVLSPASVFRMSSPVQRSDYTDAKPIEYALMDSSYRIAQGIRPPVIGHEVAFKSEEEVLIDTRKYITSCRRDIANLSWSSSDMDTTLLIADGEGSCFLAIPHRTCGGPLSDGTWGGILASWRFKRITPSGENCTALDQLQSLTNGEITTQQPSVKYAEKSMEEPEQISAVEDDSNIAQSVEATEPPEQVGQDQSVRSTRKRSASTKAKELIDSNNSADGTGNGENADSDECEWKKGESDNNDDDFKLDAQMMKRNMELKILDTPSKPRRKNFPKQENVGSDVLCVSFCRVFEPVPPSSKMQSEDCNGISMDSDVPEAREEEEFKSCTYVILGGKTGTYLYEYKGWDESTALQNPILKFTSSRSSVLSCIEHIEYCERSMTIIAIGGGMGEISVYGIWYGNKSVCGKLMIEGSRLWKASDGLGFGPVSSLTWHRLTGKDAVLQLAVAVGNNILLVEWNEPSTGGKDDTMWDDPHAIHRINDAHDYLVSAVQICVDGSVISASLDGNICRWLLQNWEEHEDGTHSVPYDIIQDAGQRSENAMSLQRTVNGFGMFALSTAMRNYREVGEVDDSMRKKYQSGSRRTLLSLFISPGDDWDGVLEIVVQAIKVYWRRERIGQAVSLWDVELFLDGCEGQNGVIEALREVFDETYAKLRSRTLVVRGREAHEHFARVLLALCRILVCSGMVSEADKCVLEKARSELFNSLLASHFEQCLVRFLRSKVSVSEIGYEERKALESMCQYVCMVSEDLLWKGAKARKSVERVRELLEPCIANGEMTTTMCPVCGPEVHMPLVADAEEANAFYCSSGEFYTRCVLTALPCTDAVPLVCQGCDARAQVGAFRIAGDSIKYAWVGRGGVCPLCRCALVPSSVEMI